MIGSLNTVAHPVNQCYYFNGKACFLSFTAQFFISPSNSSNIKMNFLMSEILEIIKGPYKLLEDMIAVFCFFDFSDIQPSNAQ